MTFFPIMLEAFDQTQTPFSDKEILDAAYSSNKYPARFYKETIRKGSIYYENEHSYKEKKWIEFCTDDQKEAREWSDKTDRAMSIHREVVQRRKTEKYFLSSQKDVSTINGTCYGGDA